MPGTVGRLQRQGEFRAGCCCHLRSDASSGGGSWHLDSGQFLGGHPAGILQPGPETVRRVDPGKPHLVLALGVVAKPVSLMHAYDDSANLPCALQPGPGLQGGAGRGWGSEGPGNRPRAVQRTRRTVQGRPDSRWGRPV